MERLKPILQQKDSGFKEKSISYLTLANLRLGENDLAKDLLQGTIDNNSFKHTEARSLLDKLSSE